MPPTPRRRGFLGAMPPTPRGWARKPSSLAHPFPDEFMAALSPEIDQLIHAVMSPLTTIYGTIQLLQRSLRAHDHSQIELLVAVLERNTVRLQQTCEFLVKHADTENDLIRITIPTDQLSSATTHIAQAAQQAVPRSYPTRPQSLLPLSDSAGHILCIVPLSDTNAILHAALTLHGHQVTSVHTASAGLDLARSMRPSLILIDPEVDLQTEFIIPLLSEDPDTKTTPLALLGLSVPSGRATPPHLINPQLPPDQIAALISTLISPEVSAHNARPHLLIVDDESDIAAMLAHQFAHEGFQTTQVYSGTAALRLTREQQFDLILL
ncbi:MAG: response regulator, partial [Candidatus Viridilinea halotolerans]